MASGKRPPFLGIFGLLLTACGHPALPAETPAPEPPTEAPSKEPAKPAEVQKPHVLERSEARERRLNQEAIDASKVQINAQAPTADALELFIIEQGPSEPWVAVVANRTSRSYQVEANPGLLSLRVQVPGKKEPFVCAPPKSERPSDTSSTQQVDLQSGEALLYRFDVRWLCFREATESVLVPGSLVEAHFGWPTLKKTRWTKGKREEYTPEQKAPFVAQGSTAVGEAAPPEAQAAAAKAKPKKAPTGAAPVDPTAMKEVLSAQLALSQAYAEPAIPDNGQAPLELSLPHGSDATDAAQVVVDIGLKNRSGAAQKLFFRRELLTFNVLGENGRVRCQPEPDDRAPDRNAFMTLAPGQFMSVPNRMVELCPTGAFSAPGLYRVTASLTATDSGKELGLNAFTGTLNAVNTAWVRLRRKSTDEARTMVKFSLNASAPAARD